MCAQPRVITQAGPHATVEEMRPGDADAPAEGPGVRVVLDLPFELRSMADAQLDISRCSLRLTGSASAGLPEVVVSMPVGYELDPEMALAKFSRKKQQLTVTSPNCAPAPEPVKAPQLVNASSPGDKDDDDDDVPILEAARGKSNAATEIPAEIHKTNLRSSAEGGTLEDIRETNDAAEAMMQKALAAREQKRKETEEARRKADLASSGGLKKGFFSSAKPSKRPDAQKQKGPEDIPYITGAGSAEDAKRASLQMPEVQQALKQGMNKLKEDQSWVTPQLMAAMQARPDLMKAMSNPKIMEAMNLMQTNPDEAKQKYNSDEEVTKFMKDFSALMATHFDVLGKDTPNPAKSSSSPSQSSIMPASPKPAASAGGYAGGLEPLPIDDPKVMQAFQDPEVQQLLAALRAGQPLEMHELCRRRPQLFQKVKILLDNGLLALQQ
eukprot:TRINITY_DN43799_c0_g1_i1.p1 TRINITY_DN43799_c0_g1~~TRINITY_DN43799_c0_g1_i1.p1  ORF type:complete len:439 (-),score=118.95 TRINITY_DN43799_c0_g1_i1:67-1383(-)